MPSADEMANLAQAFSYESIAVWLGIIRKLRPARMSGHHACRIGLLAHDPALSRRLTAGSIRLKSACLLVPLYVMKAVLRSLCMNRACSRFSHLKARCNKEHAQVQTLHALLSIMTLHRTSGIAPTRTVTQARSSWTRIPKTSETALRGVTALWR